MKFDRKQFFDNYRKAFGGLQQLQVEGLEFLLGKIETDPKWELLPQVAYLLATIRHETGITRNKVSQAFQPIKELRSKPGTKGRANQDRYWLSGYYGRGYIQLTWRANYAKFHLADNPDKALEPDTAYMIAARGMREGLFTGKKLSDYINDREVDYFEARRIVNGLDRAELIAGYAQKFERILRASVTDEVTELSPQISKVETYRIKDELEAQLQKKDVESSSQPDKGETTGIKPADETSGTPPPAPAVEVKASEIPFLTRLASLSVPTGIITAIGAVMAFAKELPPYAWIAFSAITVAAMIIGYLIYRDSKKEAHERTKIVLTAAADPGRNNLRLV